MTFETTRRNFVRTGAGVAAAASASTAGCIGSGSDDDRTVIEASAAYEAANSWQGRYFPTV